MNGLMMDDHELTLTGVVERAERLHSNREVVSRAPDGEVHRTTYGEVVARARRIASALAALGVEPGDRVATLLWNQPEHLELYFAVTSMGAVIHTLNPRLHADELAFIVGDADDKAIVVDETLLPVLDGFSEVRPIERVIVVARGGALPEGFSDYEQLISSSAARVAAGSTSARRRRCATRPERRAGRRASSTRTARSLLHSLCASLPDALGVSAPRHDPAGRADVPRERVGPPVRRGAGRRPAGSPGAEPRRRERPRPARRRER